MFTESITKQEKRNLQNLLKAASLQLQLLLHLVFFVSQP